MLVRLNERVVQYYTAVILESRARESSVGERGKLLWTEKIAVRWCGMVAIGHVNNAYYLRYIEQVR